MRTSLFARVVSFAGLLTPVSMAVAASSAEAPRPIPVTLTANDVRATDQKAAQAHAALVAMWPNEFARRNARFVAPELAPYRGYIRTACGTLTPSNAEYCPNDNTIYFDDVFVA